MLFSEIMESVGAAEQGLVRKDVDGLFSEEHGMESFAKEKSKLSEFAEEELVHAVSAALVVAVVEF